MIPNTRAGVLVFHRPRGGFLSIFPSCVISAPSNNHISLNLILSSLALLLSRLSRRRSSLITSSRTRQHGIQQFWVRSQHILRYALDPLGILPPNSRH